MNLKSLTEEKYRKYWCIAALVIIFIAAFWVRILPMRFNDLQDIDTFYIYRISEYLANNNLQIMEIDMMRNYPFGVEPITKDPFLPFYLPAALYMMVGHPAGLDFLHFVFVYTAVMGALAAVAMFFIGKEIFDTKTGLLAAFFLGTVPAFITRTSGGVFDKEGTAGVFMLMAIYFFIRSYKRDSWKSGIMGGISMLLLVESWGGGAQYLALLFPLFTLIILLLNKDVDRMVKAYIPFSIGLFASLAFPWHPNLFEINIFSGIPMVLAILLVRMAAQRFSLVKENKMLYVVPAILLIGFVGLMVAYMFTDAVSGPVNGVLGTLSFQKSVEFSTVAEATPGSWGEISGATTAAYSTQIIPVPEYILFIFSLTTLMLIGIIFMGVRFAHGFISKEKKADYMLMLMLIWILSSIWSVLGFIRMLFIIGPPVAIAAAYFIRELVDYARKMKIMQREGPWKVKLNYISVPLAIFVALLLIVNFANAFVYGAALGPSMNKYWVQSMDFLANNTTEDSNILSWWDFGYWFQTRGHRPTVTDGGWGERYPIARWFTADTKNWTDFDPWLKDKYGVDYILMDYTLPGKYGAISKISSQGQQIIGMLEFQPSQIYPKGNTTIQEFKAGPYVLWLPLDNNGGLVGPPIFLISQNGQYSSKAYVNEMCTTNGIIRVGNEAQSIGGCISVASFGLFYIPEEAKNTIFTNLMFMDGYGLPVEKVFDNQAIHIYKVIY